MSIYKYTQNEMKWTLIKSRVLLLLYANETYADCNESNKPNDTIFNANERKTITSEIN